MRATKKPSPDPRSPDRRTGIDSGMQNTGPAPGPRLRCPQCKVGFVLEDSSGDFCSRRYEVKKSCDWYYP